MDTVPDREVSDSLLLIEQIILGHLDELRQSRIVAQLMQSSTTATANVAATATQTDTQDNPEETNDLAPQTSPADPHSEDSPGSPPLPAPPPTLPFTQSNPRPSNISDEYLGMYS